ncbi:hypothetical protein DSO57_1000753 [Entomophthora muscae]|uniref:Uncharacterized protein n=1 Tax=Entomophthora muscae TaxID=34485 RepID=A0ACC2T916_9FUNG|nr:hypothetical protein DSO57_1000753 [Entomophthora muscae]
MAEQNYDAKRALSSSATPQPLNEKSTLEYIVDPDGPTPSLLPRPLSGCKLTPPPMKRTDRKDMPSQSVFLPHTHGEAVEDSEHLTNPDPPCKPPSSLLPPRILEIEDDFANEDHYLCLPDLDKYLPFKDNPN